MPIRDYITSRDILLNQAARDWRDAIRLCGGLMVRNGNAEERYIDAMITVTEEFGPYIVIAPGLAVPHARPNAGCLKGNITAITLRTPVNFGNKDNDPVKVVMALGVVDSSQHIEMISQLAECLLQEDIIGKLHQSTDPEEFLQTLCG